jgi:plastocyanin
MKQHHPHRRIHIALGSAVLVVGSAGLLIGSGAMTAHPSAAQTSASSMGNMPMAQPAGAKVAASSTVIRLHQKVVRVSISNFTFQPAKLEVSPGTRIVWTNKDGDPHTVDSTKGVWTSEALDTDSQFARSFKSTGTFPYYCSIHPFMHGTIVVKK